MAQKKLTQSSSGFGLIEMLMVLLVIAVLSVTLVKYQLNHFTNNFHAYCKSVALVQAQSLLERLRANQNAQYRTREVNLWNHSNHERLPNGQGRYECNFYTHECKVEVEWQEK